MLSVKQISQKLNVSNRRIVAMINDGILPARKFNNSWAINESDIPNRLIKKPLSKKIYYGLVFGTTNPLFSYYSVERHRIKMYEKHLYTAKHPISLLYSYSKKRAKRLSFYSNDLTNLYKNNKIIKSGVSVNKNLINSFSLEGYIPKNALSDFIIKNMLVSNEKNNVILHVVENSIYKYLLKVGINDLIIASDLSEYTSDSRIFKQANQIIDKQRSNYYDNN